MIDPSPRAAQGGERYRRSPYLVVSWRAGRPVGFDCLSGQRSPIPPDILSFLSALTKWTTASALVSADTSIGPVSDVERLLEELSERGLVQKHSARAASWPWKPWMPEAAFFHFGTRNCSYLRSTLTHDVALRRKAKRTPQPEAAKSMRGNRLPLPAARVPGSLQNALHDRRTWRRFARQHLTLEQLGTLLHLTFGVQKWARVTGQGRIALKTSPSGGARHSMEAYVVVRTLRGVDPGVYHYDAASHELVNLRRDVGSADLAHALGNQDYFLGASAFIVMTAVFARAMWRYPHARAYRTVLAEAGHLGQTFCLTATALSLAPFCTMAFRDGEVEHMLGIDGVAESAMYIVGVGTRPAGTTNPGKIPRMKKNYAPV